MLGMNYSWFKSSTVTRLTLQPLAGDCTAPIYIATHAPSHPPGPTLRCLSKYLSESPRLGSIISTPLSSRVGCSGNRQGLRKKSVNTAGAAGADRWHKYRYNQDLVHVGGVFLTLKRLSAQVFVVRVARWYDCRMLQK